MNRLSAYLKKDGWILAALLFCAALCLLLGSREAISDSEEGRLSRVLSAISGAGDVEVAFHYDQSVPCSAVIVAEGADDISVRLKLVSAVTTLLGIGQDRVAVYEREGSK